MNKKIKIIDLLNKIANGEEVPKKIKYITLIYKFDENCNQFYEEGKGSYYDSKLKYEGSIEWQFYGDYLNDEVEILEGNTEEIEEKSNTEEIEEKSNFEDMGYEIAQAYFEFYKGIAKALTKKRKESEDKQ